MAKTNIFVSLNRNEHSTLEGREFPPTEIIDTVDEIAMSDNGDTINRIIRYKPGEKSVFLDEQSGPYDKDGKIIKHGKIIFTNGILAVDERESLLLKYLRLCNANGNSEYRMPGKTAFFAEQNKVMDADNFLEQEREDRSLLNMIDGLEADEVKQYALLLGDTRIDFKKISELRADLILYAKNNPVEFRNKTKNVNLARKVHVVRALKDGYVQYDKGTRIISWENGNEIVACPIGKDPADYLVELSFHPDYEKVYASIERRIPADKLVVTQNSEQPIKKENLSAIEEMENEEQQIKRLVNTAIKKEILVRKGVYWGLPDREKGQEYYTIGMGMNQTLKKTGRDPELQKLLKIRIAEKTET